MMQSQNNKNKLLIFTSSLPRFQGDLYGSFTFDLACEIQKVVGKDRLLAIAADDKRVDPDFEKNCAIRILRYPYFFPKSLHSLCYDPGGIAENFRTKWFAKFQLLFFPFFQFFYLFRLLKKEKIDTINSHFFIFQGFVAAIFKRLNPHLTHILTIHAAGLFAVKGLPFRRMLSKFIMKHSDRVFCVSHFIKDQLDQILGFDSKAEVLSMGIPWKKLEKPENLSEAHLNEIGAGEKTIKILFVGRLVEKKGIFILLDALRQALQTHSNLKLFIIGSGNLIDKVTEKIKEGSLESHVTLLGNQPRQRVYQYYGAMDFLVVPSIFDSKGHTEGFPVVILEALACSLPVIASEISGIGEILENGKNGFLFEPGNSSDLLEKIRLMLREKYFTKIKGQCRESVKNYDWPMIAARYIDLLK